MAAPPQEPLADDSCTAWAEFQRHTGGAQRDTRTVTVQLIPVAVSRTRYVTLVPAGAGEGRVCRLRV